MRLGGLVPTLPREVWRLELAGCVDTIGNGLVLPYVVLYLHDVRGLGYATAGAVLAVTGISGLVFGAPVGIIVDRIGPRRTLIASQFLGAIGYGCLALVHSAWQAYLAAIVIGAAGAAFWPAHGNLLVALAPRDASHSAFAVSSLVRNAGIGLGATIGGVVASTSHPGTYVGLLLADAVSFIACIAIVAGLPDARLDTAAPDGPPVVGGFRAALADRALLAAITLNGAFICFTAAAFDFLAPYLKLRAGLDEHAVGLIWLANTLGVVLLQLPAGRLVGGRRRMRWAAVAGALWGTALLVFAAAGFVSGATAAVVAIVAAVIFAMGECLQTPLQSALVADIAPPALGGRYQALGSMSWDLGGLIGPALAGVIFAASPGGFWAVFAVGAFATGAAALAVERVLPVGARTAPAWR